MQQNILSQVPGSGSQQDVPGSRPGKSSRDPDTGKSRFDDVSRAEQKRLEQKRLEQKQADRREQADRSQEKQAQQRSDQQRSEEMDNRRADEARTDRKADNQAGDKTKDDSPKAESSKSTEKAARNTDKKAEESTDSQGKEVVAGEVEGLEEATDTAMAPVTFAMLQTMAGGTGKVAGTDAAVAVNSQMTGKAALQGFLNGQPGQSGQSAGNAGSAGKVLPPGAQLTDLLSANVSSETTRPTDPASLLSAPRFQTTLEQASLQPGNLQPGKLTAENAIPLRSYATSVDVPVGQAEWGDKVMGKLSFLTARNMQVAEIHLTPPDMGPMEVKVRMQNEQANITVHAANPVVREQLEQNSHRLRDMLGEQGVELGQFDVSSQSDQQTSGQGDEAGEGGSGQGNGTLAHGELEDDELQTGQLDLSWKGEVDLFA